MDREAVKYIDTYCSWGSVDKSFCVSTIKPKMRIMGNCRSDLLGKMGKDYFKDDRTVLGVYLVILSYVAIIFY